MVRIFGFRFGWIRDASIVYNPGWEHKTLIGGFVSRFGRGFMSCLRIGKVYVNLDIYE